MEVRSGSFLNMDLEGCTFPDELLSVGSEGSPTVPDMDLPGFPDIDGKTLSGNY